MVKNVDARHFVRAVLQGLSGCGINREDNGGYPVSVLGGVGSHEP